MLLTTVTVAPPLLLKMAPPRLALLPEKALLVTVRVPALWIAPLFAEKVLLVMIVVPPLLMAPPMVPPMTVPPLAMDRFWTMNVTPEFTENTPTVLPPLMVITLPPSIVVSALTIFLLVTVIVAAPRQLKVTVPSKLPPPGRQAFNAVSVQLALVPVPTTHASADEVAPNATKTSGARTSTNRVRPVVV